jgi:hypothetical protein
MAELELETIERAVRWCAEAGRQTTAEEVRAALATLGWDQLLAVRALLADPPPARPLGPQALADLGRGVQADVAAEREREQRYPHAVAGPPAPPVLARSEASVPAPRARSSQRARRAQVVVRKAAVASRPATPPLARRPPLIEELLLPAGRGELERLLRKHGGRRPLLVAAIGATHRRADGLAIGDADLDAVLEHHGLDRSFLRRERDELRHAVRAAGAVLARAAAALGHDLASLGAAISRLGLDAEVKRLREDRRADLRARATLSERALLLVGSADLLADLELLEAFELDLKERLPGHLRALSGTGEALELGMARTLAIPGSAIGPLLQRLGIDLRAPVPSPPGALKPAPPPRPRSPERAPSRAAGGRPPVRRPSGDRRAEPRPHRDRPATAPRPGARPPSARGSGSRPSASQPAGAGPSTGRSFDRRPPGDRRAGSRPSVDRKPGSRFADGRSPGNRPSGGRPSGSRPSADRTPPRRPSDGRPPRRRPGGGPSSGPRRPGQPRGRRPPR